MKRGSLSAGRGSSLLVDPYTGNVDDPSAHGLRRFFAAVTGWHRWFNATGESRATARAITGASNLAFLLLIVSGVYLWLPAIWKWAMFKARLLFRKDYPDSKSRDFHWHHIFGIWAAIPLFFVVYTGAVISYPWAANFMYTVFGAEVPQPPAQGAGPGGGGAGGPGAAQGQRGGMAAQQDGSAVFSANYLPLNAIKVDTYAVFGNLDLSALVRWN